MLAITSLHYCDCLTNVIEVEDKPGWDTSGGGENATSAQANTHGNGWAVYSEGWDPSVGASTKFGEDDDLTPAEQVEGGSWPVPQAESVDMPLAFIDGTRRPELTVGAEHEATGDLIPGLAGAFAVGAVTVRPSGQIRFEGIRVGRVVVWGGGRNVGDLVSSRTGYAWKSETIDGTDLDACLDGLQDRMLRAEAELARDAASAGWSVVLDGPLRHSSSFHSLVAGYIKSHYRRILPDSDHMAVPNLKVGQRTCLYASSRDCCTCYVRIGNPRIGASKWDGIARLEFPSSQELSAVCAHASELAALLPTFAGVAHRDKRAPVNLQPVRNLERYLSRHLGSGKQATRAARDAITDSHGP